MPLFQLPFYIVFLPLRTLIFIISKYIIRILLLSIFDYLTFHGCLSVIFQHFRKFCSSAKSCLLVVLMKHEPLNATLF